jgi:uncharacterized protein YbaR (Trm112 family)
MVLKKELMDVLACPKCKQGIKVKGMFVACEKCRLAYPILNNDIPSMIESDTWPLEKARKAGFKHTEKL